MFIKANPMEIAKRKHSSPPPASSGERPTNAAKVPNTTLASLIENFRYHERIDCSCLL